MKVSNKVITSFLVIIIIIIGVIAATFINKNIIDESDKNPNFKESENIESMKLKIEINNEVFEADLENNDTVMELIEEMPLDIEMQDLNSNEKYYYLEKTLTTKPVNPGTIDVGDIMLYGNNCLVIFYETFNTSYSYTRLGKINNIDNLKAVLGTNNVNLKLEIME